MLSEFFDRAITYLFYLGLLLIAGGYWLKDRLPIEADPSLAQPPAQQFISANEFTIDYQNLQYQVKPVATYEMNVLIVSHNDPGEWWTFDLSHDKQSIDTRDLCVVWGENVGPNLRHATFWNDDWMCNIRFPWDAPLNLEGISNNHLITDKPAVRRVIATLHTGDKVHIRGMLVNYRDPRNESWRNTSTTRTDTGNGACEVVYVEQLDIIKRGNPEIWFLYELGWKLLAATLALKFLGLFRR